jgi:preprotein translocase SecE subunit
MKILNYLKETKAEMKQVNWPSRRLTFVFTLIVILVSVLVAYYLGLFDVLFSRGLEQILYNIF